MLRAPRDLHPRTALSAFLLFALLVLVLLPVPYFLRLQVQQGRLHGTLVPLNDSLGRLEIGMLNMETGLRGYLLTGDERLLAPYTMGQQQVTDSLSTAGPLVNQRDRSVRADFAATLRDITAWQETAEPERVLRSQNNLAAALAGTAVGKQLFDTFRTDFAVLDGKVQHQLAAARVRVQTQQDDGIRVFVIAFGALGALVGAMGLLLRQRNRLLRTTAADAQYTGVLMTSVQDAILIIDPVSYRLLDVNVAAERLSGYTRAELLTRTAVELRAPEEQGAVPTVIAAALTRGELADPYTVTWLRQDGSRLELEFINAAAQLATGSVVVAVGRDISERRRVEQTLEQQRLFLQAVLDNIDTGIVACAADGRLRLFNRATEVLHGLPMQALPVDEWADHYDLYAKDGTTRLETADIPLFRALRGEPVRNVEMMIVPKHGRARTVLANGSLIMDAAGQKLGAVVAMHDITERKQAEAQLAHQAFHDSLTGLPNRALLLDRLEHALTRARRAAGALTVLFIDLDQFKTINDTRGHAAGDALLQGMAQRLLTAVRAEDTVARLGGDEFVVLLEDIGTVSEATLLAQRLLAALQQPMALALHELTLSASLGMVFSTGVDIDAGELLRRADVAMRQAKAAGRGGIAVFDPGMDAAMVAAWELELALQQALARQELRVYYQPVVDLATEGIVGVEALVRWQHPEHGLVSPATFIPLAEANGQILEIGAWVCREACRQARVWQALLPAGRPLQVNVNLSAREFQCPTLVEDVAAILRETGLPPSSLCLEVTETAVMQDIGAAVRTLRALKALGLRVALDDFGTGYSSLSYLQQFPHDTLKLDRSFVQRLPGDADTRVIVQSITALAHALGMQVTAEGMETREELAQVRAMGCDTAQGYWFCRPLPALELTALLVSGAPAAAA
ncbi:MAG: EAL domain-containing protein [Dehalococcoidia bacterium]